MIELLDDTKVSDVAGSLTEFKKKTDLSFDQMRNQAWVNSRNGKED